jgi:hypothetical protein
MRHKNEGVSPAETGTKIECAGEVQQQFTRPTYRAKVFCHGVGSGLTETSSGNPDFTVNIITNVAYFWYQFHTSLSLSKYQSSYIFVIYS